MRLFERDELDAFQKGTDLEIYVLTNWLRNLCDEIRMHSSLLSIISGNNEEVDTKYIKLVGEQMLEDAEGIDAIATKINDFISDRQCIESCSKYHNDGDGSMKDHSMVFEIESEGQE